MKKCLHCGEQIHEERYSIEVIIKGTGEKVAFHFRNAHDCFSMYLAKVRDYRKDNVVQMR